MRRWLLVLLAPLAWWISTAPAVAHDATSTAYVEVSGHGDDVRAVLDLEYDLLMKSAWLYAEAYEAKDRAEQERQLSANLTAVSQYVIDRFQVANADERCTGRATGTGQITERNKRAFVRLTIDYACMPSSPSQHAFYSALFPDGENFVHNTKTMVRYAVDGRTGAAALDPGNPQVDITSAPAATVTPSSSSRSEGLWGFAVLGGEHLLLGPDHLLFLLALLIGARSWRDVLLAASAFTLAHSATFVLGALGVVNVPAAVVEPLIALSIAVVAGLGILRRAGRLGDGESASRWQLPVAFGFGLLHGLGFASSLGIEEAGSWELVQSLLAFNVGIEVVQVALILLVFPLLLALRRTRVERQVVTGLAVAVIVVSGFWLIQRLPVAGDLIAGALGS